MKDQNTGRVGYIDSERKELLTKLTEVRARNQKIMREASMLRAEIDRLLEVNTQQIMICDRFIDEVGDDAEARHYLKTFKAALIGSRMSIESMREEVNNL